MTPDIKKFTPEEGAESFAYLRGKRHLRRNRQQAPRPRNAFIMFRQYYHRSVQGGGPRQKTNSEVSKELGSRWRSLPLHEKSYWEVLAREEKELHARKYPGYRFVPRRKSQDSSILSPEAPTQQPPQQGDSTTHIPSISNLIPNHNMIRPHPADRTTNTANRYGAVYPHGNAPLLLPLHPLAHRPEFGNHFMIPNRQEFGNHLMLPHPYPPPLLVPQTFSNSPPMHNYVAGLYHQPQQSQLPSPLHQEVKRTAPVAVSGKDFHENTANNLRPRLNA